MTRCTPAHILDREDADAADVVQRAFLERHPPLLLQDHPMRSIRARSPHRRLKAARGVRVDESWSAPRAPNVEGSPRKAGVRYTRRRVHARSFLPPTPASTPPGTSAWSELPCPDRRPIVIQTPLYGRNKLSSLPPVWTFTTEIAHMASTTRRARAIWRWNARASVGRVRRAIADG